MTSWYEKNRERLLAYGKSLRAERRRLINEARSVPCFRCGGCFPSYVMDFHHRNPSEKLFDISCGLSKKIPVLVAEIAKCDVYCANCHRVIEHGAA